MADPYGGSWSTGKAREIDETFSWAALQGWLEEACLGIAIEPVYETDIPAWQVIVHNGQTGDDREEAVMAACETEQEAELIAVALWWQSKRWRG